MVYCSAITLKSYDKKRRKKKSEKRRKRNKRNGTSVNCEKDLISVCSKLQSHLTRTKHCALTLSAVQHLKMSDVPTPGYRTWINIFFYTRYQPPFCTDSTLSGRDDLLLSIIFHSIIMGLIILCRGPFIPRRRTFFFIANLFIRFDLRLKFGFRDFGQRVDKNFSHNKRING